MANLLSLRWSLESQSPDLNANLQFTNNENKGFEEKKIRFIIH
jgi:hypothetical protein